MRRTPIKKPLKGPSQSVETNTNPIRATCRRVEAQLNARLAEKESLVQSVLDNGGRPHTVFIESDFYDDSLINVMVVCSDFESAPAGTRARGRPGPGPPARRPGAVYLARSADRVWFGSAKYAYNADTVTIDRDPSDIEEWHIGNTLLIVKGQTCTAVAATVVQWTLEPGEQVTAHVSAVGNSSVPYGWTETTRGVYFVNGMNCFGGETPSPALFLPWAQAKRVEHLDCVTTVDKASPVRSARYLVATPKVI